MNHRDLIPTGAQTQGIRHRRKSDLVPGMTWIYGLLDPDTKALRYIGRSNDPFKRLRHHVNHARNGIESHSHRVHWLRSILTRESTPAPVLIDCAATEDSRTRERCWIWWYRLCGEDLVNEADGGEGGNCWNAGLTKETDPRLAKVSETKTGAKFSAEHCRRISESKKGRKLKLTPEARAKRGARIPWNRGKTKETDPRIMAYSEKLKGQKPWCDGYTSETHPSLAAAAEKRRGKTGWSLGLTGETDERIARRNATHRKTIERKKNAKP